MRAFSEALALRPVGGIWRDRHFRAALLAAVPVWAALAVLAPLPGPPPAWGVVLYRVGIAPLVEELAFRGAVQGWLLEALPERRLFGLSAANLITTVLFCAAHAAFHAPVWVLAVAVPSVVLGHLRERLRSTLPCILCHAWYNAGRLLPVG